MKKVKVKILLLSFVLSIIGFLAFPINVKGQTSDISYTFDDNIIIDDNVDLSDVNNYNLRNMSEYTGLYNASYSFTNETDGNIPIGFNSDESGGFIRINDSITNHDKVLNLTDLGNDVLLELDYEPISEVSGSYDFWIYFSQTNKDIFHYIMDGVTTQSITLHWDTNGQLRYFSAGWFVIDYYVSNEWYNYRIDFECGAGAYLGLAPDKFNLFINGSLLGDFPMTGNPTTMDNIRYRSKSFDSGTWIIDGFGLDWLSNYTIRDNLIPFLNVSENIYEVDRYEFALRGVNDFNPEGYDNPNGWSDIEQPGGDKVGIIDEFDASFDSMIISDTSVFNDVRGIEKTFNINVEFLNISIGFLPANFDGILNQITFIIRSLDIQIITQIRIDADLDIAYLDHTGSFIDLSTNIVLTNRYDFNLFINYELDRAFLILSESGIVVEVIDFEIVNNKQGLNKIEIYSLNLEANHIRYYIDYIGIYDNGLSLVDYGWDFGVSYTGINNPTWSYHNNNLINIISNGTFHFGSIVGAYQKGESLYQIADTQAYDNNSLFINAYNAYEVDIFSARVIYTVLGSYFSVSYLKIDGVLLNESTNSYNLVYEHSEINTNESYFYSLNNRLFFNHLANDTNLEYIQANFNISNISTDGYSMSFVSNIQNNAFGFIRANFTTISNLVQFSNVERTTRFVMTQNQTLTSIIILITDRDINSISGNTFGYIYNIQLLITADISVSIITTSLIMMIIPLIMIIIPSFAISNRYGVETVIPMFILMSLVLVATSIIPVWLFFIILISCSVFIGKHRGNLR